MEFQKVMKERYICKKFSSRPVETLQLHAILETGRLAPTIKNLREQHIYAVQSEEVLAKLDSATPCRYGAVTAAVVASDKNNVFTYPGKKQDSGVEDASIVAARMMLVTKIEGVDSCRISFFDPEEMVKELRLPESEEVLVLLDLGCAAEGTKPSAAHDQCKEISETVSYMQTIKVEETIMSKTLATYFSASGVTAKLAKLLVDIIGADLHETRSEKPYSSVDLDWINEKSRSSVKTNDKSFRPTVANKVENMEQYNRVFVGFPIWWYVAPTVINISLEQYGLTGKKVIPFVILGSSGMENTNAEPTEPCKGAVFCDGRRFDTNVKATELKAWAESF